MGASGLKELAAVVSEGATSGKPQLNSKIYLEDDLRMELIMHYQDQAIQTPAYKQLERIEQEQSESAQAYWKAVDAEAMRMFKAHGAELFSDLDEAQQQRTANTVYRSRAQKIVGPAPTSSWEAKRALEEYVRAYLDAHMPERSPYADAARQRRDQQALDTFKRWHEGSKVIDREGNPFVAFHATTGSFDAFTCGDEEALRTSSRNPDYSGALGAWFAAPPLYDTNYGEGSAEDTAEGFVVGRDGISEYREGANTMPVYLAIRNPKEFGDYEDFQDERDSYDSQWDFKQAMLSAGHDGFVIRNCDTDGCNDRDDWVAFYPEQIKSALGNSNAFDPNSPSLTDAAPALVKVAESQHRAAPQSDAFNAWFGSSSVVDESGAPLVVYHGTYSAFEGDAFSYDAKGGNSYGDADIGFFFGSAEVANAFTDHDAEGSAVIPVYLSIRKPKYVQGANFVAMLDGLNTEGWNSFKAKAIAAGYDGVIVRADDEARNSEYSHQFQSDNYIAFRPEQIKSSIGNSGAFDPSSPSLTDASPVPENAVTHKLRAATQSEAFKAWFRDSKVVGEQQRPLVVYHGTNRDFSVFETGKKAKREDAYFEEYPHNALGHFTAKHPADAEAYGGIVMPLYLSLQNPKQITYNDLFSIKTKAQAKRLRLDAEAQGYDGFHVVRNNRELDFFVAFDSLQLKSAIGNSGAFDPLSPSLVDPVPLPAATVTLPARRLTESDAFKQWFGQSQLVLPTGEPMRAFHGTNKDLDVFEAGGKAQAIFVTVDAGYASVVAETKGWGDGDNVMPVYVRAENPMYVSETEYSFDAIARAKLCGFDALITRADDGTFGRTIAVFSPHQLKSAIGNSGAFELCSPSLTDAAMPGNTSEMESSMAAQSRALGMWFGNSRVVNERGDPLVVYHGTADSFDAFDKCRRGAVSESSDSKLGFFFSSSVARANLAAVDAGYPGGENIMPVYLNMQNPLIHDGQQGLPSETAKIIRKAIRAGNDGVIFMSGECGGQDYVVFEPTQIKSAIGNSGAFDPDNPSLTDRDASRELEPEGHTMESF